MPDIFSKEAVPSYKRMDSHLIDPRHITIQPEFNGRLDLPAIDDLLAEFPNSTIGQLMPVLITKVDGVPVLLDGHRRWRAAIELTRQKKGPFEDGVFKLKCSYFKGSPIECFIATVKANISRKESLPEDDGYNISRMLHNFQLSEEDIAVRVYGRVTADGKPDVKWVRERAALAELAPEATQAMKDGRLKPSAAVALSKLSKQAQKDAVKSPGKLTTAAIKRAAEPIGTGTTSEASETQQAPQKRKWDKAAFANLIGEYLEMNIPVRIAGMTCENAVRTILGQILDDLK